MEEENARTFLTKIQGHIISMVDLWEEELDSGRGLPKETQHINELLIKMGSKKATRILKAFKEVIDVDSLRIAAINEKKKSGKLLGVRGGTPIFINGKDLIHVGGDPDKDFLERARQRCEFFENYFIKEEEVSLRFKECVNREKQRVSP